MEHTLNIHGNFAAIHCAEGHGDEKFLGEDPLPWG